MHQPQEQDTRARQHWMSVLARADEADLRSHLDAMADVPEYLLLRAPEVGLAMVRARTGNSGTRFNLGEMTVTRCAVRLEDGSLGFAYVAGRKPGLAELAAVFDALLQNEDRRPHLMERLVEPLAERQQNRRAVARAKAASTKVDFFTLVRGS